MATIKLQLDERTVERARHVAIAHDSTLEALVGEIVEMVAGTQATDDPLLGMFAQEPELINQVTESAMLARQVASLRLPNG